MPWSAVASSLSTVSRASRSRGQGLLGLHLVLGKIDEDGEVGQHVEHQAAGGADLPGQAAVELPDGQAQAGLGSCLDHVENGLGLVQGDAAVDKGAGGELAGGGQAGALGQAEREHALEGQPVRRGR